MAWEHKSDTPELQQMRRVALCIPHTGMATYGHFEGLIQYIVNAQGYQVMLLTQSGTPVDVSRNIMISRGLILNVGKFFFVDSDIRLTPQIFDIMIASQLPVVSAAYMQRSPDFNPVAYFGGEQLRREVTKLNRQYIPVDEVGAGCLLVDRIVIERIAQRIDQWFCLTDHKKDGFDEAVTYKNKQAIQLKYRCKICNGLLTTTFFQYRLGFFKTDPVSEDFYFCRQIKRAGFDIHVVNDTVAKHEPRVGDWWIDENGMQTKLVNAGDIRDNPNDVRGMQ